MIGRRVLAAVVAVVGLCSGANARTAPFDGAQVIESPPGGFLLLSGSASAAADAATGIVTAAASVNDEPPLGLPTWIGLDGQSAYGMGVVFAQLPAPVAGHLHFAVARVQVNAGDYEVETVGSATARASAHLELYEGGTCNESYCTGRLIWWETRHIACSGEVVGLDRSCDSTGPGVIDLGVPFSSDRIESPLWLRAGVHAGVAPRGLGSGRASIRGTVLDLTIVPFQQA